MIFINVLFSFSKGKLQEGDELPESLTLINHENKEVPVKEVVDGKWLVLYFYPKDQTPGCTAQAKAFSDYIQDFEKLGVQVVGVSSDDANSHRKFTEKHGLKVSLMSDKSGDLAKAFGVKILFGMCSRDTIIIDPDGKVDKVYKGVSPKANPLQVLDYLKQKTEQ